MRDARHSCLCFIELADGERRREGAVTWNRRGSLNWLIFLSYVLLVSVCVLEHGWLEHSDTTRALEEADLLFGVAKLERCELREVEVTSFLCHAAKAASVGAVVWGTILGGPEQFFSAGDFVSQFRPRLARPGVF